jgi:mannose-6-phosphate isomerase-like protein (cupin superfamily)
MDTPVYKWNLDEGELTAENAIRWLEKKGYAASEWHDRPGSVYTDYVHEMDEVVWLIQGAAELEMDGKAYSLKPGGGIFIPAKRPHTLRIKGTGKTVYVAGYFGYSPY